MGHHAASARRRFGAHGEDLAAEWYAAHGYRILDRNWRCAEGELDLVCRQGATLVICEVKARRSDSYGTPLDAVTAAKRWRVRRLAARWLRVHRIHCDTVRFDVVAVHPEEIEVIVDAW